jgi:adenylosuccinate synthase
LNDAVGEGLRKRGHEFGTTTGRPRRCGWLDLNLVKYTNMINGYDSLNITKLDILDEVSEIKVGVEYKLNGKKIDSLPGSL